MPIADETKGLGTGEVDQKLKLDFIKRFSSYYGFLAFSYKKRGEPEDTILRNTKALSVGFSRSLEQSRSWGAFYDYKTASRSGNDDIQECSVFYALSVSDEVKVSTYGLIGLSDSSAKFGLGIQFSYRIK
ncbi:MAG: hypothetical protein JKY24_09535 [Pseudomonadales bacterium]|nr:hypothetical protein [Pseudomonadales bacterium]